MKNLFFLFLLFITQSHSQISGCTDPLAKNYNPKATFNDGSCCYKRVKIKPLFSVNLSDSIVETSSLIHYGGLLWTTNDDTDATVYGIDFNGVIKKKININGLKNKEWEEISQDSTFIYLGDFGNNYQGNRKDLRILRLHKSELFSAKPTIDTIAFSYANQSNFSIQKPNKTNFDCEAFIVLQDSIFLFTKHFKDRRTTVYSLPKTPGTFVAKEKETYKVKGLITGATYVDEKKLIALTGYNKHLKPFIYLLDDFEGNHFFSGNKRKIKLKLPFHQVEGITSTDGLNFYITNEKAVRKPLFNVRQQLHQIDLSSYLKN
ncbi:T9SS C-terminal target domain-containing protein [Flavobacterium sp. NG2]|uniref:T9SS C-terminal target domain-containing protein n=1 Tax=Flavobacterium sp. NG2 TaxID=3097547 RepID=UPI002A82FF16|nr:T9SS C-terminal target domain-containing protein [Flavobacterium sp. NG2]WPR71289.1 T9SS C-terminal target domain-containing protein [Flavobacterium sp. NG2]